MEFPQKLFSFLIWRDWWKEKLEEKDISPEMPGTSMVWMSNKMKRINSKLLEFFYPELTLLV